MNLERYPTKAASDYKRFEFYSVGPKGTIKKVVLYQRFRMYDYNIAFGDWDEEGNKLDDTSRSNNNDRDKVLTTVAFTVLEFLERYPGAKIFALGDAPEKSRLYQMKINKYLGDIDRQFYIQGYFQNMWEDFVPGKNYDAFLLWTK